MAWKFHVEHVHIIKLDNKLGALIERAVKALEADRVSPEEEEQLDRIVARAKATAARVKALNAKT